MSSFSQNFCLFQVLLLLLAIFARIHANSDLTNEKVDDIPPIGGTEMGDISTEEPQDNVLPTFNEFQAKITEQKNRITEKVIETQEEANSVRNDSDKKAHDSQLSSKPPEKPKGPGEDKEKPKEFIEPNNSPEIDKKLLIRKNLADISCGAKLLEANPMAKYAHHILNDNLDEYMNQPCSSDKWFVIEICEPIMIQAIQIANLEMFSSRLKTFKVFVSDRYPTKTWTPIGLFQAHDQRSLQLFKLRDDHLIKFVRFEIIDHYGNEHFCPITLVKIFGLITDEIDDLQEIIPMILPPGSPSNGDSKLTEEKKTEKPVVINGKEESVKEEANKPLSPGAKVPVEKKEPGGSPNKPGIKENPKQDTIAKDNVAPAKPDKSKDKTEDKPESKEPPKVTVPETPSTPSNHTDKTDLKGASETSTKTKENSNFFYKATQYFVSLIRGTFLASEPKKENSENIKITIEDIDTIPLAPDELMVIEYLLYMQNSSPQYPISNRSILTWSNDLNSCVQSLQRILVNYGHLNLHYGPSNNPGLAMSIFNTPLIFHQVCNYAMDYLGGDDLTQNFQRGNFLIRMLAGYRNITRLKDEVLGPKKIYKPISLTPLSAYQLAKIIIKYSNIESIRPSNDTLSNNPQPQSNSTNSTDSEIDESKIEHFVDEYVVPSGTILGYRKETAFMRITNRIRQMEENVSVSMHYLEELSQNYRIQTEKLAKNSEWMQIAYARLEKIDAELNSRIDYLMNKIEIMERRIITSHSGSKNYFVPLDPWSHRSVTLLDRFFPPDFDNQFYFNLSINNVPFGNLSNVGGKVSTFPSFGQNWWVPLSLNWFYSKCQEIWDHLIKKNVHQYCFNSQRTGSLDDSLKEQVWYRVSRRLRDLRTRKLFTGKAEEENFVNYLNSKIKAYLESISPEETKKEEPCLFSTLKNHRIMFQRILEVLFLTIVFQFFIYWIYLRDKFEQINQRMTQLSEIQRRLDLRIEEFHQLHVRSQTESYHIPSRSPIDLSDETVDKENRIKQSDGVPPENVFQSVKSCQNFSKIPSSPQISQNYFKSQLKDLDLDNAKEL